METCKKHNLELDKNTGCPECFNIKERLESIRGSIKAENISYGEIAELQSLADFIDEQDVELLERAGCCEGCGKPILSNQSSVDNRHTTCI